MEILWGANRGRYRNMVEEWQEDFTKGNTYYPIDITEAYKTLVKYNMIHSMSAIRLGEYSEEVSFDNVRGDEGGRGYKGGGGSRAHG